VVELAIAFVFAASFGVVVKALVVTRRWTRRLDVSVRKFDRVAP
jgi:hypothetical protein